MHIDARPAGLAAVLLLLATVQASAQTAAGSGMIQIVQAAPPPAASQMAAPPPVVRHLTLDAAELPPMPRVVPRAERDRAVLMAAGAGAAAGVILVDLLSGGILLLPLGLPTLSALNGAAAAVPAAGWSVAQRLLAGVATSASALGGGFIGSRIVGSEFAPDVPQ